MFGNPETTPGGNALKFYASVRLDVRRKSHLKNEEGAFGSQTKVKVVKNKCAPPFREAEFEIRYGTGIDAASDLLDSALEAGLVTQSGAHFAFGNEKLGQGRDKVREKLIGTAELQLAMRDALLGARAAANSSTVSN